MAPRGPSHGPSRPRRGSLAAPRGPSRPLATPLTAPRSPAAPSQSLLPLSRLPRGPSRPLAAPHGPSRGPSRPLRGPSRPLAAPRGPSHGPSWPRSFSAAAAPALAAAAAAAAPAPAAPAAATTDSSTRSRRRPQPPPPPTPAAAAAAAVSAAAAPARRGTLAPGAAAAATAARGPWSSRPCSSRPWPLEQQSLGGRTATAATAATTAPAAPGGGQMQLQRRPRESLTPQLLREWYATWGCWGGRSGSRPGVSSSAAACSGLVQLQRRPCVVLSPQQLREWYAQRGGSRGTARCPYVICTGARTGQPCGTFGHAESRCFACLRDAWRTEFGDASELPDWVELLRLRVDIYTLDYDAILTTMYALPTSDEGDCYLCVPPDPGIEAAPLGAGEAALGASASAAPGAGESALSGTTSAQALHTFTLDSGASRSFFRDRTTLTPLSRPVAVSLADPSGGPVLAHLSIVLRCPAAPSGSLSGLYLPSFSTNLVSGADLQDGGVDQFTPARQRVTHCTCARTGRHLATFTRQPGSSLYTLTTESPQVAASSLVFAAASRSGPESAPCSCRLLSHQTLLWHHRLGHPSLPRLRGLPSRFLVSGLPRSLPSLPPWPAPTCLPCVEGRQRAAPHSSEFPPTEAPLQTLHMDVWGPACVRGQGHERYFLVVVDDYSRYTTVFPLRSKAFYRAQGIRQTFTLPASPQQNGIAERRIGMVMDVARTSMIHAAAPHFLWPFAFRYAAHQINLQPRVSLPETSPTLRWTGKVGDASASRVWGSRAFVRDLSADKLSPRAVPCVFLGFPPDAPGWQFYHPTSRRVLSSQDIRFDESVPFYRLFPYRTTPLPPPPLFLTPGVALVDPMPPQVPAPLGVSQVDPVDPIEVAIDCGPARGTERAEPNGAGSGGTEPGGAEPGGAETGGAEPRDTETVGAEPGGGETAGAEPGGAVLGGAGSGGPEPRGAAPGGAPSSQQLREWYSWYCRSLRGAAGAGAESAEPTRVGVAADPGVGAGGAGAFVLEGARTGGTGAAGTRGAAGAIGDGPAGGAAGAARGTGAAGPGGAPCAGAAVSAGAGSPAGVAAGGTGAVPAVFGGAARPRPYLVPLLEQVLGLPPSTGPAPPLECPQLDQSQSQLQPASPLPTPSPYTGPTGGIAERRAPASRPVSPIWTLFVLRLLATVFIDPSFESTAASALVAELVDFAAHCRLDYAASLVAESESVCPPSVGGECALSTDVLEDRQEEFQCFAAALPHLWQSAMDAEMASWKSTGTYVDEVPPPGANIVSGMWIFRVKRCRVLRLFSRRVTLRQATREWHDTLRTTLAALGFAPSTADPSLFLRTDTSLPPFYILVYVDDLVFATPDTAGLAHVKSELQKRHTCTDLGELRSYLGLQITRDRAQRTITLTQSHMVQQVLQRFDFTYSSPQATPLSTRHSLSALPSDESVEPSDPYPELVGCLMYLMTCTRPDLAYPLSILARYVALGRHRPEHMAAAKRVLRYLCSTSGMGLVLGGRRSVVLTGHADASWAYDQATQRSSQGYTFSLGSGSVSWLSTRSSSFLGSSCEAEIYAGAMAAQELRWLTYLLTDLGEPPRSPPVLYVDNKAMQALCREHRLEHRTKHIAVRYFLARELQQPGQLRLAYVASQANTADIFTKALPPCDHQRCCTMLGLVPTWPHLLTS
ncbi:unnamed protein product [Closterium sp. NIES-64]|nr:unnamed protein product [Closterium sp. NIES-64]